MKITTIIPTYNRAKFLPKAIESVLNQTQKVNEIIIVDDGSTDDTKEVVNQYSVKYIYQENSGVSSARNIGIKNSSNQWITFLDSDDIWEESKIEKQINFHTKNPNIKFSYTNELWKFNNKIIKQNKKQQKLDNSSFIDHIFLCKIGASTVCIHKSILDDIGVFDENLLACEDYDLWLRILKKYDVGYIDEQLIIKIAGHKGQLSFETKGQDYYRILALLKHKNSIYKEDIAKEIKKRKEILLKGALKHKNEFYIEFCRLL